MTPYEMALAAAASSPFVNTFDEDLQTHLRDGWVLSTPDYFLMARSVSRDWPEDVLLTPEVSDPSGDAWMIWAAAGNWMLAAGEGMALAGWKPWLCFHRRGVLRFVESARLIQRP